MNGYSMNQGKEERTSYLEKVFAFALTVLTATFFSFALVSCAGGPERSGEEVGEKQKHTAGVQKKVPDTEARSVSVEEVESSLTGLSIQMSIPSHFESHRQGAKSLEEVLTVLFVLENDPLPEKAGPKRAVYRESGDVYHSFYRYIKTEEKRGRLWSFVHRVEEETVHFDVLADGNGIPLEIRYTDRETGQRRISTTDYESLLKQNKETSRRAELIRSFVRGRRESARNMLPLYYRGLEKLDTETIEEGGRKLEALHLKKKLCEGYGGDLHVWYSPRVLGGILRVKIGKEPKKVGIESWEAEILE